MPLDCSRRQPDRHTAADVQHLPGGEPGPGVEERCHMVGNFFRLAHSA